MLTTEKSFAEEILDLCHEVKRQIEWNQTAIKYGIPLWYDAEGNLVHTG